MKEIDYKLTLIIKQTLKQKKEIELLTLMLNRLDVEKLDKIILMLEEMKK